MKSETIVFSRQMLTVIVEHTRVVTARLKERWGLSYNEFTLLYALLEVARPVDTGSLGEYLLLRRETVTGLLLDLEDKGLVVRVPGQKDRRVLLVQLSRKGATETREAAADLERLLCAAFMSSMQDAQRHMRTWGGMLASVSALRGTAVVPFCEIDEPTGIFNASYYLYWRLMVEGWSEAVRREGGISLVESRVLGLVNELGQASPAVLADRLFVSRSSVSVAKGALVKAGLLQEASDPFDGRGSILRCTKTGAALDGSLSRALGAVAQRGHQSLSDEEVTMLNGWYMRMYADYRCYRNNTDSVN